MVTGTGDRPLTEPTAAQQLMTRLGGVSGVLYSSLPVVVFVAASELSGLLPAIGAALGVAALLLLWQVIRRDPTRPAVYGFVGVAFCALMAYALGESKGYFLLGIWTSLGWALAFALSVLIRRPVVGYLWGWIGGPRGWRDVRRAVYAFDIATLTWTLVFAARFAVQSQLYDAGRTGWLGVARLAMGLPLTAVAAVVTFLAIKAAQRALEAAAASASLSGPEEAADAAPPPPR